MASSYIGHFSHFSGNSMIGDMLRLFDREAHLLLLSLCIAGLTAPPLQAHKPHDVVNVVEVSPVLSDGTQVLLAAVTLSDIFLLVRSEDDGATFQYISTPFAAHGIQDIVFSPDFATNRLCWIATKVTGVWRSFDGGITWSLIINGLGSLESRSMDISADGTALLLATSDGVYRATVGGTAWVAQITLPQAAGINDVAFAGAGSHLAFAGSDTLFRTEDGGNSWAPVHQFSVPVDTLAPSPLYDQDQTLMVGFGRFGNGSVFSQNGGLSFLPQLDGLDDLYVYDVALAADGTTFALGRSGGLFRADGVGAPWVQFTKGFEVLSDLTEEHFRSMCLSTSFEEDQTLFVGAFEGLFRSENQGQSFLQADLHTVKYHRGLCLSPNYSSDRTLLAGSYGGGCLVRTPTPLPGVSGGNLRATTSLGGTASPPSPPRGGHLPTPPEIGKWSSRSTGLKSLYTAAMAFSPNYSQDNTLFYSYNDLWMSPDRGLNWDEISVPQSIDVVRCFAVSPSWPSDRTILVGSSEGGGVWLYDQRGGGWSMTTGLPNVFTAHSLHMSDRWEIDGTAIIATKHKGLYLTSDAGLSATAIGAGLPPDVSIRAVELAPKFSTSQLIAMGTAFDGLFLSTDGGLNFSSSNEGLPETSVLVIEDIVFSPDFATDGTIFLATLGQGIWRSGDGGLHWEPSSNGLPVTSCRLLAISPDFSNDQTVYLSTQDHLYRSTDGGVSWGALPSYARIDNQYHQAEYEGIWTQTLEPGYTGLDVHKSDGKGDRTSLSFVGDSVSWYGDVGPDQGIVKITVDEKDPILVDLYAPALEKSRLIFHLDLDLLGSHAIHIQVTGDRHPQSSGTWVSSDGFDYTY